MRVRGNYNIASININISRQIKLTKIKLKYPNTVFGKRATTMDCPYKHN